MKVKIQTNCSLRKKKGKINTKKYESTILRTGVINVNRSN